MSDALIVGFIAVGTPVFFIALFSWVLHYFIALKSAPARRAAWTAGIAYAIVAIAGALTTPAQYWWIVSLAPIPAALIAFWFWRNDFRRDWIEDAEGVPEGVELATDDWRIGILELLIFITIVCAVIAVRFFSQNL